MILLSNTSVPHLKPIPAMGSAHKMRLSGLQREVLSLYRKCLREARKKPAVSGLFSYDNLAWTTDHPRDTGRSRQLQELRKVWLWTRRWRVSYQVLTDRNGSRGEFMKNIGLDKKDFSAIEYHLRKGQRQLEIYASPGIRNILR